MQYYQTYVVRKRFKQLGICGQVNLPYGTECTVIDYGDGKFIACNQGVICCVTSQNAYDYFSQNDDQCGLERGILVGKILSRLASLNSNTKTKNAFWDKVWSDEICNKYKRTDIEDHWLWDYSFYNAGISDLHYIANLVGAK